MASKGKKDFRQAFAGLAAPAATAPTPAPGPSQQSQPADPVVEAAPIVLGPKVGGEERLQARLKLAEEIRHEGGLAGAPVQFTREAAVAANRPLRKHRTADLVLHPQNPRPVSGDTDLDEIAEDMRKQGQKDPIHIVPLGDKWAIIEGQRRWLSAKRVDIEYLECFEHPEMTPTEVYAYGRSIHRTRQDTTAIDEARSLKRLLDDTGMTRTQLREWLEKQGDKYSEGELSKMLAINSAHEDLMRHVNARPKAFSHRHLYALTQFVKVVSLNRAIIEAEAIRYAPEDKPVSANSLERVLARINETGERSRKRRMSTPKVIADAKGRDVGTCRGFEDGKIEFKPIKRLPRELGEELHAVISKTIHAFFEEHEVSQGEEKADSDAT